MKRKLDVDRIARAIEVDAGEVLPELRQALAEAQARAGRVTTPDQMLVRQAREATGLTQQAFAERINTPLATLRDWEQGRFPPPGGVLCLLRLIVRRPDLVSELAAA